jgi:hypothetical protein
LGLLSPSNPSFSGICKVRKFYYNSAFNAQGSRGILLAVQVGAVKIYVALVKALGKKEREGETQETIKMFF